MSKDYKSNYLEILTCGARYGLCIVAKKYMLVRRFQSISSRIKVSEINQCLLAIREMKELRTLGPYTSRSVYGEILSAKFSMVSMK